MKAQKLYLTLNAQIYFDLPSKDIMVVIMPLLHSGGLNIAALPALYGGATIIIMRYFDVQEALQTIERHRVTQMMAVPTMLNLMLKRADLDKYDLSSLRTCLVAGEPVSVSLLEEYLKRSLPVRQAFGQTETSIQLWLPAEDAVRKVGSVGRPVLHGEVKIINKQGDDVVPGEIGEIVVRGPIQMTGYWNDPEQTASVMKDGWLYTGDLARVDEEGYTYIVDRERDMYVK